MNDSGLSKLDLAHVTLALESLESDTSEPTSVISDADLAGFYHGSLNESDRSRVMHAIAHGSDDYLRWMELVEVMETLDEAGIHDSAMSGRAGDVFFSSELTPGALAHVKGLGRSLRSTVGRSFGHLTSKLLLTGPGLRGAGFVCAAVLVVAIVPRFYQSSEPDVDELYAQYGEIDRSAVSSSSMLPKKSVGSLFATELPERTAAESELVLGLQAGFKSFADLEISDEWNSTTQVDIAGSATTDQDESSMYSLGRLVALSIVQCRYASENSYFEVVKPIFEVLIGMADASRWQSDLAIVEIPGQDSAKLVASARQEVCALSTTILESL